MVCVDADVNVSGIESVMLGVRHRYKEGSYTEQQNDDPHDEKDRKSRRCH